MTEIVDFLKKYTDGKQNTEKVEISVLQLNRVIKALEQEPILDKIRAEIEQLKLHKALFLTSDNKVCIDSRDVLNVIDKYKAESEGEK